MSNIRLVEDHKPATDGNARFTVIGVGGGGGNAVEHMVRSGVRGVSFICANTDQQALATMSAPKIIQLGVQSTRGLGAGANPQKGREAAIEEEGAIREALQGSDMVFVTAGMGGGTGTGAAPVVAQIAKEMGILTVGVVTTPFAFEGRRRSRAAEQGIKELAEQVDSLIIIPNEKLLTVYGDITMVEALKKADDVLLNAVRSIFDLIINHGQINLDFADLKTAMSTRGFAMMGIGSARGNNRAQQAAEMAISSPLLDNIRLENAKGVLINITGGEEFKLREVQEISDIVGQIADLDEGDVFYGTVIDPTMSGDEITVTVIATGLSREEPGTQAPVRQHAAAPAAPARHTGLSSPARSNVVAPVVEEDEDDLPAISRRSAAPVREEPAPASAERKPQFTVQDFLKRQQR